MLGTVEFRFEVPGGLQLTLERSVISGSSRLRAGGETIARSSEPGRPFHIPLGDGGTAKLYVHGRGYDYVPRVVVDGKEIPVARRLALWEYAVAASPLLLVIPGAYLGAIAGFAGMAANQWILRTAEPLAKRLAGTILVAAIGYGAVELVVLALRSAIQAATG